MTDQKSIFIPGGVTLASGRGIEKSKGALIFKSEVKTNPLFLVGGSGVRISGLRLRGPNNERRTEESQKLIKEGRYYSIPIANCIQVFHPGFELDNSELWGWSHAAVFLRKGATWARIHHNYIHHNQRYGLGYGVMLDEADALIEANIFDWNRHAIAGTGRPGTSYEARFNLILENANSYSFDMHGGKDRQDGTNIAGDWINIHHNTFRATDVKAIIINGKPRIGAEIHHNWFLHQDLNSAFVQLNATGNMHVYRNIFSEKRVLVE